MMMRMIGLNNMWKKQFEEELKELRDEIKILKKDSHPPQEFVCCRRCGCKIAKIKNKKENK